MGDSYNALWSPPQALLSQSPALHDLDRLRLDAGVHEPHRMELHTTSLGDLARANPSATRVFLRHRLDFCCGGRRTLAEACEHAGLNPAEIAAELEQEAARGDSATRWESRSQTELADHIEGHYRAGLRRDLPPLIEAARKVER